MIAVMTFAALSPFVSLVTYPRAGTRKRSAGALTVLAVLLSLGAAFVALFYTYAINIEAGLCGDTPLAAQIAAVAAYLVVAAWAARSPRNLWAWPCAVLSGVAVLALVSYFFAGAHVYCET